MKKCPTCEKTFDDAMRFCQVDGTPLVDDVPFDPYATIVGTSANIAQTAEPAAADPTPSQSAISVPEEILEAPNSDPLKTMYVSDSEMEQVLGAVGDAPVEEIKADEVETEAPVLEVPPMPEPPPPSFSDMAPPPSPFTEPSLSNEEPVPAPPMFLEPEPATQEADTVIPPEVAAAVAPPHAPVQEWTPPPPPDASWQNQEIASNVPFQTPVVGGENKTLAIISLVLGIISLCCYVSPLTGLAALVTGFMAMKNVNNDPAQYGGKGLAIAGMILGGLFFLVGVAYWVFLLFFGGLAMIMDATR
jgi:hypothetical protein